MTLLTICQDAANIIGIPKPAAVTSSTETSVIQLLSVANQEGKSLVRSYPWNVITKEGSFTTAAAESQGAMTTIASDFGRFSNNTMWNRTTDRKFYGPLNNAQWQRLKASVQSGVTNYFRIRGGYLLMNPVPTVNDSIYFEYISKWWVDTTGNGVADAEKFAADSNTTCLLYTSPSPRD